MQFKLPSMEKTFNIELNGSITGVTFAGQFTYKKPSLGAKSKIDVMHKSMNGDLRTLDDNTYLFNQAISYLRYSLISFPDWWKETSMGMELHDSNVVIEVYNKCIDFESEFLTKLHSKEGEGLTDAQVEEPSISI